MDRCCKNCNFWYFHDNTKSVGDCRRYAPRPHYLELNSTSTGPFPPSTMPDYWCGEFQPGPMATAFERLLQTSCHDLDVSTRVSNVFYQENLSTLYEVIVRTENEWLRCPNFGRKGLNDLKDALYKQFKLTLRPPGIDGYNSSGHLRPPEQR